MRASLLLMAMTVLVSGCQTLEEMQSGAAYVVTSNTGPNGNVEPRGDMQVTPGSMQTIFFVPSPGYEIANVIVDGDGLGSLPSYVFANIQRDHVVSVTFRPLLVSQNEPVPPKKSSKKARNKKQPKKKQVSRKKQKPHSVTKSMAKKVPKPPVVAPKSVPIVATAPVVVATSVVAVKPVVVTASVVAADPVVNIQRNSTPVPQVRAEPRSQITTFAGEPDAKGLSIAREADRRDEGWGDYLVDMIMELSNRNGDTVTRFMHYKGLEQADDGDKTVIVFDRPADIKGTALLTHAHRGRTNDDQWLYLPAVKRVKRISSATKTGAFMGSEFSYEEFSSQEVDKFYFTWLRDDVVDGIEHYVLEARPIDPKSGYVRQVRWLDKKELRIQRIDYYDRKNSLLKTLKMEQYSRHLGKYWRAKSFHMVNHQSGRKTRLVWQNYRFSQGLTNNVFAKNSLKRSR